MDVLLEGVKLPAYIVAVASAFLLGVKAVLLIKSPNGNGHLAPEIRQALQATTITLTALTERLAHLPTKEDLRDVAEKNRHAYRNDLQAVQGVLGEQIERAEVAILRELGRNPA